MGKEQEVLDWYKSRGLRLFRLIPKSKAPATTHGFKDAKQVYDAEYFRGYNIGIACGSGLLVVDVDNKNGKQGNDLWRDLINEFFGGIEPTTWIVETPNGGKHIYLWTKDDVPNCALGDDASIDIQSAGKYVVAPPSTLEHGAYNFIYPFPDEVTIAEAPESFVAFLKQRKLNKVTEVVTTEHGNPNALIEVERALEQLDPSLPRKQWLDAMMATKSTEHPSAQEVFKQWSMKSDKFDEAAFNRDWHSIVPNISGGISHKTIFHLLKEGKYSVQSEAVAVIESQQVITKINVFPDEYVDGAFKFFKNRFNQIYRYQPDYGYLGPIIILQALAQRRLSLPSFSVTGQYHILVGDPSSYKSSFLGIVRSAIHKMQPLCLMGEPRSSAGIKKAFCEYPSRVWLSDEGLKILAETLTTRNINDLERYSELLKLYGNPSILQGNYNKKVEDSIVDVLSPRFCWVAAGVTEQLKKLFSFSKFHDDGYASRFAFWQAAGIKASWDEKNEAALKAGDHWPEKLEDIASELIGAAFSVQASDKHPNLKPMTFNQRSYKYAGEIHDGRYKRLEKENPDCTDFYERLFGRLISYAGLHAFGCGRIEITEDDLYIGERLCEYHIDVFKKYYESTSGDLWIDTYQEIRRIMATGKTFDRVGVYRLMKRRFREERYHYVKRDVFDNMVKTEEIRLVGGTKNKYYIPVTFTQKSK